jgi:hypothetical protein
MARKAHKDWRNREIIIQHCGCLRITQVALLCLRRVLAMAGNVRFTSAARKASTLSKLGVSPEQIASAPQITQPLKGVKPPAVVSSLSRGKAGD